MKTYIQNEDGSWDLVIFMVKDVIDGIPQLGEEMHREYVGFKQGSEDVYLPSNTYTKNGTNTTTIEEEEDTSRITKLEQTINQILLKMEEFTNGNGKGKTTG